jgi:hypothetical protein
MSHFETINTMRLVRTRPSLRQTLERWIAAAHHRAVVARLRRFREKLESDMAPERWTVLEAPTVVILADACNALALTEEERATILGPDGERALAGILESRPVPSLYVQLNERQTKALGHVRRYGSITNGEFQVLCPEVSSETLRGDLADLVSRRLLVKNGRNKGTRYEPAQ